MKSSLNFLQGHAILTEVHYDCFNFNFVDFLSLTHPSRLERIPAEINSFEILFSPKMLNTIQFSADWGFISIYSFKIYRAENFLILPLTPPSPTCCKYSRVYTHPAALRHVLWHLIWDYTVCSGTSHSNR